jgi:hypothetical protein
LRRSAYFFSTSMAFLNSAVVGVCMARSRVRVQALRFRHGRSSPQKLNANLQSLQKSTGAFRYGLGVVTAQTQYNLKNAKEYFEEHLCVGDYYNEGEQVNGEWFGHGGERLGLIEYCVR